MRRFAQPLLKRFRALIPALMLLAGILFAPATLAGTWAVTGAGPAALLSSASVVIIYYIPLLALLAAVFGHFRASFAALPIALIGVMEVMALVPGLAPPDLLGAMFSPVFPHTAFDVLGKSLFLALGAVAAILSMLAGITIFRLVSSVLAVAQCTTMVLFHLVTFTWPFTGIEAQERALLADTVQRRGSITALCDTGDRICAEGTVRDMMIAAHKLLPNAHRLSSFLQDTSGTSNIRHVWLENPAPGSLDRIHLVSVEKLTADRAAIMVSSHGPSLVYEELRKGAGVLIAMFHQAWITIALLILSRHGNYRYTGWRWRRQQPPHGQDPAP